jgi:hypothetical protein
VGEAVHRVCVVRWNQCQPCASPSSHPRHHSQSTSTTLLECLHRDLPQDAKVIDPSSDLYTVSAQPYNTRLQQSVAPPLAVVYRECVDRRAGGFQLRWDRTEATLSHPIAVSS